MPKVVTTSGKSFAVDGVQSIFSEAKANGVLFEHSCLAGRCSACQARLIEGETENISYEFGLTQEEKDAGMILTCVTRAKSDIRIEIQDLGNITLFPVRTVPSKINALERITESVML